MEISSCARRAAGIEGRRIHYRARNFCSDECCEEFNDDFNIEPGDF